MMSSYARILDRAAHPGTLRFSLTGLFARLPISMVGLGIVLMVESARGSYGVAGAVSASFMAANALVAIVQGRLLDTLGQGRVLSLAAVAFGLASSLLVWSVQAGWSVGTTCVAAALAGASLPQISSCVRARWAHVLDSPAELQTAFALEAVADEAVFMIGPILATVLSTVVHPAAGLVSAVVAGVGGGLVFASQRATEPPPAPHDRAQGARAPMPWATLLPLALGCFGLGVLFGAAEVTTVAFAEEQGQRAWSGLLLALWAFGSLLAGFGSGATTWRISVDTRLRRGAFAMALAMVPLSFVGSLPMMGVLLFVGGFAIAPTMIAAMTLTEQRMPKGRLTEGMSVIQTGLVVGIAPGAALSGIVVDHQGASAAYLVSLGAGLIAALAAQLVPREAAAVLEKV